MAFDFCPVMQKSLSPLAFLSFSLPNILYFYCPHDQYMEFSLYFPNCSIRTGFKLSSCFFLSPHLILANLVLYSSMFCAHSISTSRPFQLSVLLFGKLNFFVTLNILSSLIYIRVFLFCHSSLESFFCSCVKVPLIICHD